MSSKAHVGALDGMRGLAALGVLLSHTGIAVEPIGTLAVWFFFVLSAYLLTRPFIDRADAFAPTHILAFLIRRIFRIMPLYVAFVVVFGIMTKESSYIYSNLVLFKGQGHLWTINQELVFYLALPFVVAFFYPIRRYPLLVAALFLLVASVIGRVLTRDVISINAIAGSMPFYASPFLVGMAFCFASKPLENATKRLSQFHADIVLACLVLAALAFCRYVTTASGPGLNMAGLRPFPAALLLGAVMTWAVCTPKNALKTACNWRPLRIFGELGFGIYLFHWLVIHIVPHEPTLAWFFTIGAMTYGFAVIGHHLIEKPGIELGRVLSSLVQRLGRSFTPHPGGIQVGVDAVAFAPLGHPNGPAASGSMTISPGYRARL